MSEDRTPMWCDSCRGSDTDPRHHVMMEDGTIQTRHMDCCRSEGCLDQSCDSILTESGERRGDDLLRWIHKNTQSAKTPVVLKKRKK